MYEKALQALEDCFHELHKESAGVVSDHWEQVMAYEKKVYQLD